MIASEADLAKAARARAGQQAAALAYQRAVGRVLAAHRLGPIAAIAALNEAGLKPSRGDEWTAKMLGGIGARIRARCRRDPAFAAEVASWSPKPAPLPVVSREDREAARRAEKQAERAAEQAKWRAIAEAWKADLAASAARSEAANKAREDARKAAKAEVREVRRQGKCAEVIAADIHRTELGMAAARAAAKKQREKAWRRIEPLVAGSPWSVVAEKANKLGIRRLRGGRGWTRRSVALLAKRMTAGG